MVDDCEHCNKWREHYFWDHAKCIHFFKTMNGDFSKQMSIPEKLTSNFCKLGSQNIELKNPIGNSWNVRIEKRDGCLWFGNGWKEFVEAHCVEIGDVLMFKYYGNSCFDVLVMDGTGCEKVSAYFIKKNNKKTKIGCVERNDNSVEIVNTPFCSPTVIECDSSSSSDGVQCELNHRANQSEGNLSHKIHNVASNRKRKPGRPCTDLEAQVELEMPRKYNLGNIIISRKKHSTASEKKNLLRFVRSVQPKYPFFVSIMHLTHISSRCFLTIPIGFMCRLPNTSQIILLQTPGGERSWPINYLVQKNIAGFTGQWKRFVIDNKLKEGDICLFELVGKKEEIRMNVYFWQPS